MNHLERRIRALEDRVEASKSQVPVRIVWVSVHGGAFSGEKHYAWAADDLSDLIERRPGEAEESFRDRASRFVSPEGAKFGCKGGTYHLAPRPRDWGHGERTPELFERLGVPG